MTRSRRAWLTAGLLVSLTPVLAALPSFAQESTRVDPEPCPLTYTCLEHEGIQLQLDPADGPYQVVVVAEVKTVTTTALDDMTERGVIAAGFVEGDDGVFTFDREYHRDRAGVFKDAELGDLLLLGE